MNIKGLDNSIINEDIERVLAGDLPWDDLAGATVLVAGAGGMIPSYAVYTLLGLNDARGAGIRVLALVRNEEKARRTFGGVLDRSDIRLLVQDVTEPVSDGALEAAGIGRDERIDLIINGAGPARPAQHRAAPTATMRAAVLGTMHLLDLAVRRGAKAFVLMSSSEVYGSVDPSSLGGDGLIGESDYGRLDCLDPRSCYSEGKRAAETLCASYAAEHGIRCCIPRFAHIYGPGLALDDGRVQADFAANVFRGENIVMKSDGSSKRAYTYVSDAVSGMFCALLKGARTGCEAYNIADSDNVISIRELAEAFIASRPDKGLRLVIDIPKDTAGMYNPAKYIGLGNGKIKALGWTPKVGIAEGTGRMVSHLEITQG